jgi:hypothetical protein
MRWPASWPSPTATTRPLSAGNQRLLRKYVAKGQKQARGGTGFLAPPTPKKIAQLQRFYKMLPYLPVKHLMKHLTTRTATGVKLPSYSR